jgi:hypothetical protein
MCPPAQAALVEEPPQPQMVYPQGALHSPLQPQMAALLANHLAKLSLACMGAPVWECLLQDQHAKGKYKTKGSLRLLLVDIFGFREL